MEFSLIQIFAFVIVGFLATSYGVLVGAWGAFTACAFSSAAGVIVVHGG